MKPAMKTRFTLKTLLVITLVVAAYFAGRNARVGELQKEIESERAVSAELRQQLEHPPELVRFEPYREYLLKRQAQQDFLRQLQRDQRKDLFPQWWKFEPAGEWP